MAYKRNRLQQYVDENSFFDLVFFENLTNEFDFVSKYADKINFNLFFLLQRGVCNEIKERFLSKLTKDVIGIIECSRVKKLDHELKSKLDIGYNKHNQLNISTFGKYSSIYTIKLVVDSSVREDFIRSYRKTFVLSNFSDSLDLGLIVDKIDWEYDMYGALELEIRLIN